MPSLKNFNKNMTERGPNFSPRATGEAIKQAVEKVIQPWAIDYRSLLAARTLAHRLGGVVDPGNEPSEEDRKKANDGLMGKERRLYGKTIGGLFASMVAAVVFAACNNNDPTPTSIPTPTETPIPTPSSVTLETSPNPLNITAGENETDLFVRNVPNDGLGLGGFDFRITFNNAILQVQSVTGGDGLFAGNPVCNIAQANSKGVLPCNNSQGSQVPGPSGDIRVAHITFSAVGAGGSTLLTITDIEVINTNGEDYPGSTKKS